MSLVLIVAGSHAPVRATGTSGGQTGFLLGGTAQHALDPQNPANQVIKVDTTPSIECSTAGVNCPSGTVSRRLDTKISLLDDMLEFKSYFMDRSCGGGSPRIVLVIDLDGDGVADADASGYTAPPFAGCAPNRWQYDDVTDELPRWDISHLVTAGFPSLATINQMLCPSGGGGGITLLAAPAGPVACPIATNSGYIPWDVLEFVLTTLYPQHMVCSGALIDDSFWMPGAAGVAFYDVISLGKANWNNWSHTAGRGFARGCGEADHGDDCHAGDDNHDHKVDEGDRDWQQRHQDH